jgi:hypothetical protein
MVSRAESIWQWSLAELLGFVLIAAVAAQVAGTGGRWLGTSLLILAVALRVALRDFGVVGHVANAVVVLAGVVFVFLAIFWAMGTVHYG